MVSEKARAVMGLPDGAVAAGGRADLLAVAGASVQEALATSTEDRLVFRAGQLVERTRVLCERPTSADQGGSNA
jgi:hypothetical protein